MTKSMLFDNHGFLLYQTMRALLTVLVLFMAGCAANGSKVVEGNTFGQVTLRPGSTADCIGSPCDAYFEMPAGTGTYEVTGNKVKLGEYPAGKKVYLGNFYAGATVINVVGSDVAPAYLYVSALD